jgi:small subunit ribosomal protein S11
MDGSPSTDTGTTPDAGPVRGGIAHIHASFNNIIVSISDVCGNVLCQESGGSVGLKGTRKGTPFAARLAAERAALKAMEHGVRRVLVRVKGPGAGREAAIRALHTAGLRVVEIQDVTPLPHNGCRAPKGRR